MRSSKVAFVALSALAFSATYAAAQSTTLVFNTFLQPRHTFNTQVLQPWAADIEKAT